MLVIKHILSRDSWLWTNIRLKAKVFSLVRLDSLGIGLSVVLVGYQGYLHCQAQSSPSLDGLS